MLQKQETNSATTFDNRIQLMGDEIPGIIKTFDQYIQYVDDVTYKLQNFANEQCNLFQAAAEFRNDIISRVSGSQQLFDLTEKSNQMFKDLEKCIDFIEKKKSCLTEIIDNIKLYNYNGYGNGNPSKYLAKDRLNKIFTNMAEEGTFPSKKDDLNNNNINDLTPTEDLSDYYDIISNKINDNDDDKEDDKNDDDKEDDKNDDDKYKLTEAPKETPTEISKETPKETPTETPTKSPTEKPIEKPNNQNDDKNNDELLPNKHQENDNTIESNLNNYVTNNKFSNKNGNEIIQNEILNNGLEKNKTSFENSFDNILSDETDKNDSDNYVSIPIIGNINHGKHNNKAKQNKNSSIAKTAVGVSMATLAATTLGSNVMKKDIIDELLDDEDNGGKYDSKENLKKEEDDKKKSIVDLKNSLLKDENDKDNETREKKDVK